MVLPAYTLGVQSRETTTAPVASVDPEDPTSRTMLAKGYSGEGYEGEAEMWEGAERQAHQVHGVKLVR